MRQLPGLQNLLLLLSLAWLSGCSVFSSAVDPDPYKQYDPTAFYLYLPEGYPSDQAWPLLVGVHGTAEDGRSCWETWQPYADAEGYVLLCPELSDMQGQLHQARGNEKLFHIIERLYKNYELQARIILVGFSAGAQFVQGYAFRYPAYITGVSVIAPGNIYQPPTYARHIRFAVIVGDRDNPLTVQNASTLARELHLTGYAVENHLLEGVGHTISGGAREITLELFRNVVP